MRSQDIDVAGAVDAATALKQELDCILDRLSQCRQELIAAEEHMSHERTKFETEQEALRQERYFVVISFAPCVFFA